MNNSFFKKSVYYFGIGNTDCDYNSREILGNKGAGLAEMSKMGIPVPPGFTISTEICCQYLKNPDILSDDLKNQILEAIGKLEAKLGLSLGDSSNPLLLSIRSGSQVSMPGMMETILNLGLNDITVEGLAKNTKNPRFAYDCYRRYIEMYSHVVLGLDKLKFKNIFESQKALFGKKEDVELTADDIKAIIYEYKKLVSICLMRDFPQDIMEQLWEAIIGVFRSWNTARASRYRQINGIDGNIGTAVNIQSMVFGNKGNNSATGVTFTRNPSTGEKEIFGEFILNAQGEDIVSGAKTPQPINIFSKKRGLGSLTSMEELMPQSYKELKTILSKLEHQYKDMQDVEFTVEEGKCWILQTRSGKRTSIAAVKIAIDMLNEGVLTKKEVFNNIEPSSIERMLHPTIDPKAKRTLLTKGLPASPGAGCGKIALTSANAEVMARSSKVILVRSETSPEDISGIDISAGILTSKGGMTSHAAVVARGMGRPCITGAYDVVVDHKKNAIKIKNTTLSEGDYITINGSTGEVFLGQVDTIQIKLDKCFQVLVDIAEETADLKVRANAETIKDAKIAKEFNAEGIGLCRTEHMFFQAERLEIFRKMILTKDLGIHTGILNDLLSFQQEDFYQLFKIMDGLPVTIRLLDPPLHEFLPKENQEEILSMSKLMFRDVENIRQKINSLKEVNPMLGHRGCRLAITYPEIYKMQVTAILRATYQCMKNGINAIPEIMVPLVMNGKEFLMIKKLIVNVAQALESDLNVKFKYKVGSMVELPVAIMNVADIAKEADFISFGTNDLTQTFLGISRDDSGKFLHTYIEEGLFRKDPFVSIDKTVRELLKAAVSSSRKVNNKIKIGVCGEHAGDDESIKFFDSIKLDYISCSPFRIPIGKVATAKYKIENEL